MADEENAPAEGEAAAESGGKGGGLGPIIALVLVAAVGAGIGAAAFMILGADEETVENIDEKSEKGPLTERSIAVPLGDILANVKGENGRRYVKVTIEVWVKKEEEPNINQPSILAMLRESLEERLHAFDMQNLANEYIHTSLRRIFKDEMDKKLRYILGKENTDVSYIEQVVLNNLLVQ